MKKTKIILLLVISIFMLFILFSIYNNYKQEQYIITKQEQSIKIINQIIDGKIIFFRKLISKRIKNGISGNENIKNAIVSNDPKKYKKALAYMFKSLKKENRYLNSIHYISPQNISLYRAHSPKKFGDNLTDKRKIVTETNRLKRALYGFESGTTLFSYRLSLPLSFHGEYYGVLEVGLDPFLFIDDLSIIEHYLDSAILIENSSLEKTTKLDNTINGFVKNNTYTLIGESELFKDLFKNSKIQTNLDIEYNENNYHIFSYPLYNFNGEQSANLMFAMHNTDDYEWKKENFEITIVMLIVLVFIVFYIVYYAFSYYEKRIKDLTELEKQHERKLLQQSKMASMGEMIGNIAHQWRQPLSVISTSASGLQLQWEYELLNEEKLIDSTNTIIKQTEYMSKTIDDFRNFFKSDKEKVSFSLIDSIKHNIVLVEASFKDNHIDIEESFDEDVTLVGLQSELTQAILNILNNAKDQLVKIDQDIDKVVMIKTKTSSNKVELIIDDNGGGVPDGIINKIFEPYFTTKHQSQGTGIGLYMTHEIIVQHFQGEISVENISFEYKGSSYNGARFTITLPLS